MQAESRTSLTIRKWCVGAAVPLLLVGIGSSAIISKAVYWLERGNDRRLGIGLVRGTEAVAIGIAEIGIAIALFGWYFAHNSLRLNPCYRVITGIGCVLTLGGILWALYVRFSVNVDV